MGENLSVSVSGAVPTPQWIDVVDLEEHVSSDSALMEAFVVDRRKRLEPDELVWMIHEELLKRIGAGRTFTIAVAPVKGGWVVHQPTGGRPIFPEVQAALDEVVADLQKRYRLKRTRVSRDADE
jgi:hypothetical protein